MGIATLIQFSKRMRKTAKMSSNIVTHAAGMLATHGTHLLLSLQALAEQKTLQLFMPIQSLHIIR